ncbi:ATP-binding protein [Microvirga sp. M2]|uniref:sensor histidine kinase n=1 Tax=Microvirga sp. M2 TaxID=3073270 RepID=UPI0039C3EB77
MRLRSVTMGTGFRLAAVAATIVLVSILILGFGIYSTVKGALEGQVRGGIERDMADLAPLVEQAGAAALQTRSTQDLQRRFAYRLASAEGNYLSGERWLDIRKPGWTEFETADGVAREVPFDGDVLVLTERLRSGLLLSVASDITWIDGVEDSLLTQFTWALLIGIVLALGAGALIAQALLRRVDAVARTANAIIAGDLSRRIALTGSGDDFDRLAITLNVMLDRIAGLMENLRQVSNDIAHDLRTPLARLRQGLEDARARARTMDSYQEAVDRAIGEADGLLQTFSALLRIAQIEAGARRAAFRPVDLSDALQTVVEAYEPAAEDSGRRLIATITAGIVVPGDRELIVQLIANLVENALCHTPVGTDVAVSLSTDPDGSAIAAVTDNGPGIPASEREAVLRRFYRLERSRTTPGNGLGLSLAAAVVDLHRGALSLHDNQPGLKVEIRFGPVSHFH